jgi:glycerol-3-phosphate dehydrogenase
LSQPFEQVTGSEEDVSEIQLTSVQRKKNLSLLDSEIFDVLVIGGGVTGAGVALDAVARGYRVALVEKADFASGTSSKSTKLIHGGIRYHPNFDFALVHEALIERGLLLRNAPFLVHPLAFVLPVYNGERHPIGLPFILPGGIGLNTLLDCGLWLYDGMAGRNNIGHHRRLKREEVLQCVPGLLPNGLKEGFLYYDAQTNDARLTISLLYTAANYGAIIVNYTEVTSFLTKQGLVEGACIYDHIGEQDFSVHARHIVNATGIFSEQVEALAAREPQVQIEPSKGVHLVFAREDLPIGNSAVVLPESDDKRILFIVPWQSRVIFGTTDTGTGDLDHPVATNDDIAYLLNHLNRYLTRPLTQEHIVSTYAGYRPLLKSCSTRHSNMQLSRTHAVLESSTKLVSIVGGKLTTYRRMAQDMVDILSKRDGSKLVHPTHNLPLHGSIGWHMQKQVLERDAEALGLAPDIIAQLGQSYGTEMRNILDLVACDASLAARLINDLPYIKAQVIQACRYEMALTPHDVLARRTAITLEDRRRGLDIVDDITELMAKEMGWTQQEQQLQAETYRTEIEQSIAIEKISGNPS